MTRKFTWRLRVRSYELDSLGHVNNATYARYLQEAATLASADAGYDFDWYTDHNRAWMINKMWLRYHTPATHGDELAITTWVADGRRVQSQRDYVVRRVRDDALILKARANWAYIDTEAMRPTRIPSEMLGAFDPAFETPAIDVRLARARRLEDGHTYRHRRTVQRYELDSLGHVNNAVYLNWLEQAVFEAAAEAGYPIARMRELGFVIFAGGHEIDYHSGAQDGEPIEITSRPYEIATVRGAWLQEVRHAETGALLVRDYNVGIFVDLDGRPMRAPAQFIEDVCAPPSAPQRAGRGAEDGDK